MQAATLKIPRQTRRRAQPYERVFLANLIKAKESLDQNYLTFGRMLAEAYHSGDRDAALSIWSRLGYPTFQKFVVEELGWAYRRAYALVATIDVMTEYEIPDSEALAIGSTKMALISAHARRYKISKEEVLACIGMAKDVGWDQFVDWIGKRKNPDWGRQPTTRTLRLKLQDPEFAWMNDVIDRARSLLGGQGGDGVEMSQEEVITAILKEWAEIKGIIDSPSEETE